MQIVGLANSIALDLISQFIIPFFWTTNFVLYNTVLACAIFFLLDLKGSKFWDLVWALASFVLYLFATRICGNRAAFTYMVFHVQYLFCVMFFHTFHNVLFIPKN